MTVTIHSIFNSILWGGLMALGLSALSRSRWFLCRFGVTPLVVLTAAALARCCLPVELQVTKEVGAATLNRLHKLIDRAAGSPTPETWFFEIWFTGTVLGLVLWLPKYTVRLWAARNLPVTDDDRIQRFCRKHGISGLRVAFTPRVFTPCVIGFWRETILLPDTSYTHKQLDYILRHEYAHVRHHDGLLDFALCLICVLFWWNPSVLICRAVAVRLCDHRCDTEALQSASPSAKRYYCRTLLEFASRYPSPTRQFASASLKSRFYLILYRDAGAGTARHLVTAIVALALLMSYLILLQPAYQPESADYRQYAIHEGVIEQQEDGSYIFRTESGNFIVSASEIAAIQQEETSAIYKEGGALS
ncbi:M56 family metallopeptidase [Acutalibacter intestini]|uniref:M56 family metallopeptidase n=1 Tax=Acutalibacter intestini TaxID=3093659 RepID=UPI002AC9572E|nr:M56 family metallopeptidase [Acutalibacter sp. M00204]